MPKDKEGEMIARINKQGYIEKKSIGGRGRGTVQVWRDWWFVINNNNGSRGVISLNDILFPLDMVGKKIRLKVEVIEDGKA